MQNCMNLEKLLRSKLQEWRDARKISELSKLTGISQSSLSRASNGGQTLGLDAVSKLVDFFGFSVTEMGVDPATYKMVPKVKAKAGAGSSLITEDSVQGYYAFRLPFLHRVGISSNHSVLLDVMGQSMQPLIMEGDTILVDQSQNEPKDGGIFLVGFGEELLVKRLQRTPRGWLLVSQNPDYATIHAEGEDIESLRVYGRVRWFGRVV